MPFTTQFDTDRAVLASALVCLLVAALPSNVKANGLIGAGSWPKTWPEELEPLRKQAVSWVGGQVNYTAHQINFSDRKRFEAAWPHILKLKSKGASLTLMNAGRYYSKSSDVGGVIVIPPIDGFTRGEESLTRVILIPDGKTIDLNRIRLPAETLIKDHRFTK